MVKIWTSQNRELRAILKHYSTVAGIIQVIFATTGVLKPHFYVTKDLCSQLENDTTLKCLVSSRVGILAF